MAEFRYQAVTVAGRSVQGMVLAGDHNEAKRRLARLIAEHGLRLRALQKRRPFTYRVRVPGNSKTMTGIISGFTREEVRESLARMGYQIVAVRRKLFNLKLPIPDKDLVVFIRLCADLLREQYPYDEILTMLANDIENRTLRETVLEIHKDLKMGKEGRQVYLKHAHVLGKFAAHMLSIAATSGNMAEIYDNTAKFLERSAEFKKNLRSALFMPTIVLLATIGALVFYVAYIFPKIAGLLLKYDIEIPPLTAATLSFSSFLKGNFWWLLPAFIAPIAAVVAYCRSDKGRIVWHRLLIAMPVIGKVIYKTSIEVFARFFHALYSGSGENIEVIKLAAESCRNRYIEMRIKQQVIPSMLREGRSLSDSLGRAGVFPQNAIAGLRTGEESGTMREAALRLANFYEKESTHKMARILDLINLVVALFISIIIVGITLLSSEIGFVSPPTPMAN